MMNVNEDKLIPNLLYTKQDFDRLNSEEKLRLLAKKIPSQTSTQSKEITQKSVAKTVFAMQEFLTQIITGLSFTNPSVARNIGLSSSGLDYRYWQNLVESDSEIPTYPVRSFLTYGVLHGGAFGTRPLEPVITVAAKNSGYVEFDDFWVQFSVTDTEDMRILGLFMEEAADLWDQFEDEFGITPFSSFPLPEEERVRLGENANCREYINAFIKHHLKNDDGETNVETIDLEFAIDPDAPLHEPIVAAIALLQAFSIYIFSVENIDSHHAHDHAFEILENALRAGKNNRYWKETNTQ